MKTNKLRFFIQNCHGMLTVTIQIRNFVDTESGFCLLFVLIVSFLIHEQTWEMCQLQLVMNAVRGKSGLEAEGNKGEHQTEAQTSHRHRHIISFHHIWASVVVVLVGGLMF